MMKSILILGLLGVTTLACATSHDTPGDESDRDPVDSTSEDITGNTTTPVHQPSAGTLEYMSIVVSLAQHFQKDAPAANPLKRVVVGTKRGDLLVDKGWAYIEARVEFTHPGDGETYALLKYDAATVTWQIVELTQASDDPRPETLTWRTKHPEAGNIVRTTWNP